MKRFFYCTKNYSLNVLCELCNLIDLMLINMILMKLIVGIICIIYFLKKNIERKLTYSLIIYNEIKLIVTRISVTMNSFSFSQGIIRYILKLSNVTNMNRHLFFTSILMLINKNIYNHIVTVHILCFADKLKQT